MSSDVWSHIQELFKLQNEPLKRAGITAEAYWIRLGTNGATTEQTALLCRYENYVFKELANYPLSCKTEPLLSPFSASHAPFQTKRRRERRWREEEERKEGEIKRTIRPKWLLWRGIRKQTGLQRAAGSVSRGNYHHYYCDHVYSDYLLPTYGLTVMQQQRRRGENRSEETRTHLNLLARGRERERYTRVSTATVIVLFKLSVFSLMLFYLTSKLFSQLKWNCVKAILTVLQVTSHSEIDTFLSAKTTASGKHNC